MNANAKIRLATVDGQPVGKFRIAIHRKFKMETQGLGDGYHSAMAGHLAFIRDVHVREVRRLFAEHAAFCKGEGA